MSASYPILFILFWSSGALFVEGALNGNNPLGFAFFRVLLACLMLAIMLGRGFIKNSQVLVDRKMIGRCVITGLFLQCGYQLFFSLALNTHVSPGILAIILSMQPMLTPFIALEKQSFIQWLGLTLGFIGSTVFIYQTLLTGHSIGVGIAYAVIALACISIGTVLQKKLCGAYPIRLNLFIQSSASLVIIFIIYASFGFPSINWTVNYTASLIWMACVISVLSVLLFYHLLKQGKITQVTSYFFCVAPVTALLDFLIYQHRLSRLAMVCMVVIIIGQLLIHQAKRGMFIHERHSCF